MKNSLLLVVFVAAFSCAIGQPLTSFVDPFLGTGAHGHVYPGAQVPFGMVQLSPDNGDQGWDWCSGYHYSSNTIAGFSHTHLSGTGIGDWCDISVLPFPDTQGISKPVIKSPFSHDNEKASPGYYQVRLNNQINCELTAAERTGYHRYSFPGKTGWLRFDLGFAINWDAPTDCGITVLNDSTIVGYRFSTGWAKGQKIYFAAHFSQPIMRHFFISDSVRKNDTAIGKQVKLAMEFAASRPLQVVVSLSSVSSTAALRQMNADIGLAFDAAAARAAGLWEAELSKIEIQSEDSAFKSRFYTALYRTSLAPALYSDADGSYQTFDKKIKRMPAGNNKYTELSQWDVFRALYPLYSITQPRLLPQFVNSMLSFYNDNGLLPVWDLSTWETNTMSGYHSMPIIADAILKNTKGFNYEVAYQAMRKSAFQMQRGTPDYIKYGYLPQDKVGQSVTITLEYAFDDWCIAQVAKKLGKTADYNLFMKRAASYKKIFDANSGFMRGRNSDGKFVEPFDPLLSEHGEGGQYIEGTAWQHSFFVPHDLPGLAALYGGESQLEKKLDELFNAPSVLHGDNTSNDVSGLIGQYAHGNEPSHHIIYFYTLLGQPQKAAKWLKVVTDSLYKNGPEGLSGNDDCGQMSAWYVWTSLGMYPMNPASGEYVFGYPLVESATLKLPNGKQLKISVKESVESGDAGVRSVWLNNKQLRGGLIHHTQLLQGGELKFVVVR